VATPPPVLPPEVGGQVQEAPVAEANPLSLPTATTEPSPQPEVRRTGITSRLIGTVVDKDERPLPGVTVTLSSDSIIGGPLVAITDVNGELGFGLLPPGDYSLEAALPGFVKSEVAARVGVGPATRVHLAMAPAKFAGEISVTSESPIVDTSQVNSGVDYSTDLVNRSAASTEYSAVARGGARPAPTPSAVAGRSNENVYLVNGVNTTAPPSTGGITEPNDQPYGDVFFADHGVNPFVDTDDDHLSTFGMEVDTGSYTVLRRYLEDGHLPPREAVRSEELLNFFDYNDPPPAEGDFALNAEGAPSPFTTNDRYRVLRFAVKGRVIDPDDRKPATLIFVVDVSGSMATGNRLDLVKQALGELLNELREDDRVGLVIYGSQGEVLLDPTDNLGAIRRAIGGLASGGSTNAEEGLVLAYRLAARHQEHGRINRVILCSDGVANVGRTGPDSLLERIDKWASDGIELTTVGFGMGNYNDVVMEQLADAGDGRYAYVDTLDEARRLFVDELTGTLQTIAYDAKAQVEFNPEVVARYRLIGYENRDIADERFRDPTVDAGEIGAGHAVTALYEIKLQRWAGRRETLATLRVRYRPADGGGREVELERTICRKDLSRRWEQASTALRLATLVAEYGELLKGSYWASGGSMELVLELAEGLERELRGDARVEGFVDLVDRAAELRRE